MAPAWLELRRCPHRRGQHLQPGNDRDEAVAAIYPLPGDSQGMPSHWVSYVSILSADEAAKRAADLGGTLLMEPFDVMTAGRMAVIKDPTGAVVAVWERRTTAALPL